VARCRALLDRGEQAARSQVRPARRPAKGAHPVIWSTAAASASSAPVSRDQTPGPSKREEERRNDGRFYQWPLAMVVYQQIENYVLQPTIIGKAARISGFTVLASVLAFEALFGLIGAIIGVPIAAGIQIVVEEPAPPGELASPPRTPPGSLSRRGVKATATGSDCSRSHRELHPVGSRSRDRMDRLR
jgi:hypothetical protein